MSAQWLALVAALCGFAAAEGNVSSFRGTRVPSQIRVEAVVSPARPEPATDLAPGTYSVMNVNSGKYLNVIAGSREAFANVQIWNNPESSHSQWRLTKASEYGSVTIRGGMPGIYLLQNVNSDLYLSVADGSAEGMKHVFQQRDGTSKPAQWLIQLVGQGIYGLQNVATGKWLNVVGGGRDNGVDVWQWNDVLQNHSWWTFEAPQCQGEYAVCNWRAASPQCCMEGTGTKRMSCDYVQQTGEGYCQDTSKCTRSACGGSRTCCGDLKCHYFGPVNLCLP